MAYKVQVPGTRYRYCHVSLGTRDESLARDEPH
jgi:hypothetical protein